MYVLFHIYVGADFVDLTGEQLTYLRQTFDRPGLIFKSSGYYCNPTPETSAKTDSSRILLINCIDRSLLAVWIYD